MSYVFTIPNGKRQQKVVAGLTWFPLVPDNFKKELIPLASDMGADMYAYRKSNKSVLGLGKAEDGVQQGMASLGLYVSRYLEEFSADISALVAFQLPGAEDRYSIIIVRDGFIMPEWDKVGPREEIETLFRTVSSSGDWERQFCPKEWDVPNTEEISLTEILQADKKGKTNYPDAWLMRPVKPSLAATAFKAFFVLALLSVPLQGYQMFRADQEKKKQVFVAAQAAAAEEQARQERLNAEPWKAMVQASDFAKACSGAMNSVGLVAGTWEVHDFICENGSFTIKWERSSGETWVKHMRAIHPSAKITQDGAFATVTTKLNLPRLEGGGSAPLRSFQAEVDRLLDLPNEQPVGVTLRFPPAPPAPPGVVVESMPWSEVKVTATTELNLETAAKVLSSPGYRITKIYGTFKGGVLKYELEGVQYGKN